MLRHEYRQQLSEDAEYLLGKEKNACQKILIAPITG